MSDNNIVFTEAAANKVGELILEEGNLKLNLRIYITGGGCSGFQYGFAFDENINSDDIIVTQKYSKSSDDKLLEVKLLVDSMSYQYLDSAEVDYKEDLKGAQFIIRNPNAKTTCGCGSSFSIDDEDDE